MKQLLSSLFLVCACVIFGESQERIISGQILDASTNEALEFVSVTLFKNQSKDLITGEVTNTDGKFSLSTKASDFYLEVSFLGYQTKTINGSSMASNDLGKIYLESDRQQLDEVVVTAEKSTTEFRLDKRVFNVGQDLSSTGASAFEVLNNVPSVNVNIEGQVSLRGSTGVQILIDGKPSVLASDQSNALGSITADMIQSVEVITNPSAKYEAEGTSGIINIVLKKEDKKGINGSVTLNTGVPHNHSVGLSMNRRTEKWNVFTQAGVGYRELPNDSRNINRNLVTNDELQSVGEEFRNEVFYNFNLGADYYIDPNNVITLSGNYAYEIEDQPSETQFDFIPFGAEPSSSWIRSEETEATNPKLQYELQYKRDFEDHKDHDLLFSAIGNYFGKEQSSIFENQALTGNVELFNQRTATKFDEGKYTFKLDYTKPFQSNWTIETGAQYLLNNVGNEFTVENLVNGVYEEDPGLTNDFEYTQNVLGVYGTTSYEGDLWGVKAGLRMENTELNTLLVTTQEENDRNFTNLFPSLHSSYKIWDNLSVQAGYSRRIYRPRLWDLNPFFNIRNNFVIRTGNPDLLPEFTDSYEAGLIYIKGELSTNFNVYFRRTEDVIERISSFEDNVTFFRPLNLGVESSTGLEFNFKYSPFRKLSFNGDVNYNYFSREGSFEGTSFDFNADQYSGKLTTKYKVSKSFDVETTGRYESKRRTVQGEVADNASLDLGMRYKVDKGRIVLNFSVRDVFASRIRQSEAFQETFYSFSRRLRGRFITFGMSYGFGKGEAMQYSGRRRR